MSPSETIRMCIAQILNLLSIISLYCSSRVIWPSNFATSFSSIFFLFNENRAPISKVRLIIMTGNSL